MVLLVFLSLLPLLLLVVVGVVTAILLLLLLPFLHVVLIYVHLMRVRYTLIYTQEFRNNLQFPMLLAHTFPA